MVRVERTVTANGEELGGLMQFAFEEPVEHPSGHVTFSVKTRWGLEHVLRCPLAARGIRVRGASEDAQEPAVRAANLE